MNFGLNQDVDPTYPIKFDLSVLILVTIAHPIQGSTVHVVLFVT